MNFMLKRSLYTRNAALALFAVLVVLAGAKSYFVWSKMKAYAHAVDLQSNGRDLEAEAAFAKAQSMRAIDYKEREIADALSALQPVTDLKRTAARLLADVNAARNASDVPTLVKAWQQWSQIGQAYAGKDEKARTQFAQIASESGLDRQLADAFAQVKSHLTNGLENAPANKNADDGERLLFFLQQIPAVYYPDEKAKNAELNRLAQKYGGARLNGLLKGTSLAEAVNEGDRLLQLYKGMRLDGSWIAGKLEPYIQSVLSGQLEKNDVKGFLGNVRIVREHPAVASAKTDTFVRSSVGKLLARAAQLADARKFQDAIELYTLLGSYQNTDKEIRETEQRWMETDPVRLLSKAAGEDRDLSYIASVKGKWGDKAIAAGLAENKTLILARLLQDGSVGKNEIEVGRGVTVTSIQLSDSIGTGANPVLLLEAASKSRKARYLVYEAEPQELRLLLDAEADGIAVIRKGVLQLDNPSGDGAAGDKALYEYRDRALRKVLQQPQQQTEQRQPGQQSQQQQQESGRQQSQQQQSEYKNVTLSELPTVKTGNARFECEIVTIDGANALGQGDNRYVLLAGSGKMNWKRGTALITGTYAGTEEMKMNGQTVTVYKVNVSGVSYP